MTTESRPNVVFIVGDNVGWGDIGCYGGTAPTPRIDAFAAERHPLLEAQFTPTRYSRALGERSG